MEYLKNNTESKFLKVVLQSKEKFQQKKSKNKPLNMEDIRDIPTSLSNTNSKRLDSVQQRGSRVFNDLKSILHHDPMKAKHHHISTPQAREFAKVRSFESIEEHFKNEDTITSKANLTNDHHK